MKEDTDRNEGEYKDATENQDKAGAECMDAVDYEDVDEINKDTMGNKTQGKQMKRTMRK